MLKGFLSHVMNNADENDGIYERREQRGEIPEEPQFIWQARASKMEEQKQEIQRLKLENRRLYRELEELQKQLETMNYVHSIDDLIDTMREEKPKASSNPFALFANGGNTGSGTDSGTHADKMLSPDSFEGVVPDTDDEIVGEAIAEPIDAEWANEINRIMSDYEFRPAESVAGQYAARMFSYADAACRYL